MYQVFCHKEFQKSIKNNNVVFLYSTFVPSQKNIKNVCEFCAL